MPRPQTITPAVPPARIVLVPAPAVAGTTASATTTETPAPATRSAIRARHIPTVVAQRPTVAQPEILLDPAETRALLGLIADARTGRVNLAAVQNSVSPEPMALAPIADIVIAPITIDPIAPLSGGEGVRP